MDNTNNNSPQNQYETLGLSGLYNMGNTCYMNSAIQALSSVGQLVSYLLYPNKDDDDYYQNILKNNIIEKMRKNNDIEESNKLTDNDINIIRGIYKNSMIYRLKKTLDCMWTDICTVKPISVKLGLDEHNSEFRGFGQKDSQECLSFIIDKIHDELSTQCTVEIDIDNSFIELYDTFNTIEKILENKTKYSQFQKDNIELIMEYKAYLYWKQYLKYNYSVMIDIFSGMFLTNIKCTECENIFLNFTAYNSISLNIPNTTSTLDECLTKDFCSTETLENDEMYQCNICQKKCVAITSTSLWEVPQVLILHLKRFTNEMNKNYNYVNFPLENFDIGPYINSYHKDDNIKYMYDLTCVICHTGNRHGGHYIAYTKNCINKKWYLYDDSHVVHIPDEEINNTINNQNAYVLLYTKII
jgi:ubiquitin C-terminal hydrolase